MYLKQLADAGLLSEIKSGREKLFLHCKFLRLVIEEGNTFEPY